MYLLGMGTISRYPNNCICFEYSDANFEFEYLLFVPDLIAYDEFKMNFNRDVPA